MSQGNANTLRLNLVLEHPDLKKAPIISALLSDGYIVSSTDDSEVMVRLRAARKVNINELEAGSGQERALIITTSEIVETHVFSKFPRDQ